MELSQEIFDDDETFYKATMKYCANCNHFFDCNYGFTIEDIKHCLLNKIKKDSEKIDGEIDNLKLKTLLNQL